MFFASLSLQTCCCSAVFKGFCGCFCLCLKLQNGERQRSVRVELYVHCAQGAPLVVIITFVDTVQFCDIHSLKSLQFDSGMTERLVRRQQLAGRVVST